MTRPIPVRLTDDEIAALDRLAGQLEVSRSEVIRRALLSGMESMQGKYTRTVEPLRTTSAEDAERQIGTLVKVTGYGRPGIVNKVGMIVDVVFPDDRLVEFDGRAEWVYVGHLRPASAD